MKNIVIFDQYLLYLGNSTKYDCSYNGRWIGTRMWSIYWYHFQWSWVTAVLLFTVMIFFNIKQLENSTRLSYIYNGRLIGSRMWSIEFCHFSDIGWPLILFGIEDDYLPCISFPICSLFTANFVPSLVLLLILLLMFVNVCVLFSAALWK